MRNRFTVVAAVVTLSGCIFGGGDDPAVGRNADPNATQNNAVDMASDAGDASGVTDASDNDVAVPDAEPDLPPGPCGDGLLEPPGERCDPGIAAGLVGACPESCDDDIACTADVMMGSSQTCDVSCQNYAITDCVHGDGCCAPGCTPDDDDDCVVDAVCGDGIVNGVELCDFSIAAGEAGACFQSGDECPQVECSTAITLGAPQNCDVSCSSVPITMCTDGDGCCPTGCEQATDDDCTSVCGNGLVEPPSETCDGDCPVTAADCGSPGACFTVSVVGDPATCSSVCEQTQITACVDGDGCCPDMCDSGNDNDCSASCGNSVIDAGETCDPPGSCVTSCDDGNSCTNDTLTGSAANCNAECNFQAITVCSGTPDGCCPAICNANTDADCMPVCGNGAIEPGETCEGAGCPARLEDCNDMNACTTDAFRGDPATCTSFCENTAVTQPVNGDGCCPPNANAVNDDDCMPVCGNNVVEPPEACDGACPTSCNDGDVCTQDFLVGQASNCTAQCVFQNRGCSDDDGCCPAGCNNNTDNDCSASCGNNITEDGETCDGSNCPSMSDCAAMGPCHILTGSAGSCTAQCIVDPGCTPCTDTCDCPADQFCGVGLGRCVPGTPPDCELACDPDNWCETYGMYPYCELNSYTCVECLDDSHCPDGGSCDPDSYSCITPETCDQQADGDEWCVQSYGTGFYCYFSTCIQCLSYTECASGEFCDADNTCQTITSCDEAPFPDGWCRDNGLGNHCDAGVCVECLDNDECGPIDFCDVGTCNLANTCDEANDPPAWCMVSMLGNSCAGGMCSSINTFCTMNTECHPIQACDGSTNSCVVAIGCEKARDPNYWCQVFEGLSVCDTNSGNCVGQPTN